MTISGITPSREAALREKVREKQKARKRNGPHDGHNIKVTKVLLRRMERSRNYSNEDLGVILEDEGFNSSSVGPATTWAVRNEYLDRVGRGQYRKLKNFDQ